jgi:hypothetical protein
MSWRVSFIVPGREIGSGPAPWRHLVPRMTPMMIGYFCQGWTGWLYVTWMPSTALMNAAGVVAGILSPFAFGLNP